MSPLRALSLLAVYLPTALAECKTYCPYRTHPIEEKCGWAGCDTCVPCLPCMPHCPVATQPWEEKCEWAGCNGCGECTNVRERAQALSGAGASKAGPRPLSELEAGVARGPWTAVARMDVVLPVLENPVHA